MENYATVLRVLLLLKELLKEFRKNIQYTTSGRFEHLHASASFDLMQSPSRLQVTDPWQQEDKEELSHKQCNLHNHQHVQSNVCQALLIRQKSWTFQNFVTLQTKEGVQISFRSLFLFYFYEVNVVKGYVWFSYLFG